MITAYAFIPPTTTPINVRVSPPTSTCLPPILPPVCLPPSSLPPTLFIPPTYRPVPINTRPFPPKIHRNPKSPAQIASPRLKILPSCLRPPRIRPNCLHTPKTRSKYAQIASTLPKYAHIASRRPKPAHIASTRAKPAHIASSRPKYAQVASPRPKPAQIASTRPKPAHIASPRPKLAQIASTRPKYAQIASTRPKYAQERMRSVGSGVVVVGEGRKGYLDLTKDALDALISREPIHEHYQLEHTPFARGKFAAVRRARCMQTGRTLAAKVMRKRRRAQDVRHEILHEAAVLLLAHPAPGIVSIHRGYETPTEIILLLELAEGGELQRVIDEEESLEEGVVRRYMSNILGALRFLHAHNIAHLDLKPQNLLLMGQHPNSEVKLCDFGISRIILSDIEVREVLGTPDYVAPEILQYEPISLATDMWSVGVLAYVLLTGHSPFGGDTKQETFLNISQGQVDFPEDLFSHVSRLAIRFITQLLVVDPTGRLTVDEALQHLWLNGVCSTSRTLPCKSPITSPTRSPKVASPTHAKEPEQRTPSSSSLSSYHSHTSSPECSVQALTSPTRASPTCSTDGKWSSVSARQVREQDVCGPSTSAYHTTRDRDTASFHIARETDGTTFHTTRDTETTFHTTAFHTTREADPATREGSSSPWKPSHSINKENNKNTLNKTEDVLATCRELPGHESPSKSKGRLSHIEKVKRELEKARREAEMPKKMSNNSSKEGKENKENGKESKESVKEKLKPSPLCLRRQGSKCDLKSPSEQQKYGAGTVSIILEKSIIC